MSSASMASVLVTAPGTPSGLSGTWGSGMGTAPFGSGLGSGPDGDWDVGRARCVLEGLLAQLAPYALARLTQLIAQLGQLGGTVLYQLELAIDVTERLLQELAAALWMDVIALQLGAYGRASILGGEQVLELVECHAEQLLQAYDLAQALDLGLRVEPMSTRGTLGRTGEQADLLVVANRAGSGACKLGDIADAQVGWCAHARAPACNTGSVSTATWAGRSMHTNAPTTEVATSTHKATCMLEMNGSSALVDRPLVTPEKTANKVAFGTAAVTIARTKAIGSTAP